MITDIVNLAGEQAYFKNAAGDINICGTQVQSPALGKGKQMNVSGIYFALEGSDLIPLFNILEDDDSGTGNMIKRANPLISITVIKEIFPKLFTDPFRTRVHTIAGFDDFRRGTFKNCDVYKINGVPTVVSIGTQGCVWKSIKYELPEDLNFAMSQWELASSRDTSESAFRYSMKLNCFDNAGNALPAIVLANNLNPVDSRVATIDITNVRFYELEFLADVFHDSYVSERIISAKAETIGRPLLESLHLLEPVQSKYDFYSLEEFLAECSEYNLLEMQGLPLKKLIAYLDLSSILTYSSNQDTSANLYERISIEVSPLYFNYITARLDAEILFKPIL